MTIADFLYQAGFWQWIGLLMLFSIMCKSIAHGMANFNPLLRQKIVTKNKYIDAKTED